MKKTLKAHDERNVKQKDAGSVPDGALPTYLLDREGQKDAKALEGLIAEINDSIQDKIVVRMVVDTFNLVGAHVLTDAGHTGRQGRLSKRFPG